MKYTKVIAFVCAALFVFKQTQAQTNNYPQAISNPPQTVSYPYLNNYPAGGTNKRNFVRSFIPAKPTVNTADLAISVAAQQNNPCITQTKYFDGLGRPLQEVYRSAGVSNTDVVQVHTYDDAGREAAQYLAYPLADWLTYDHGKLKINPRDQLIAAYNTLYPNQEPYALNEYEHSPLNKVEKSYAPGKSWVGSGNGITFRQDGNETLEEVRIWTIGNNNTSIPQSSQAYSQAALHVTTVTDEDGQYTISYTDKGGKLILQKKFLYNNHSAYGGFAATYYVYDDMNRLRYVIPPEAVSEARTHNWDLTSLAALCYRYWYDTRGRLIEKQVPGKAEEYFVYDRKDRLIMSQDGNMRYNRTNNWAFITYDGLDRPLVTGICAFPISNNRETLATAMEANGSIYPANDVLHYIYNTNLFNIYPGTLTNGTVHVYNYYDDYTHSTSSGFNPAFTSQLTGTPGFVLPLVPTGNTRGLLTGTRIKVMDPLNDNLFISTTNFYDKQGHLIQQQANNIQGGEDILTSQYDFQGTAISTVLRHTVATSFDPDHSVVNIVKTFSKNYFTGKIAGEQQNLGDGFKPIFYNSYDALGRVLRKDLGGNAKNLFTYNIRGWLTGINEGNLETPGSPDFFHEKISYDAGFSDPMLNGNISGIMWRDAGSTAPVRYYGYAYDKLSRLTGADFGEHAPGSAITTWSNATNDFSVSGIDYDINGNIRQMNQRGPGTSGPVDMDLLEYTYAANSNQLLDVVDHGVTSAAPDFNDGNTGSSHDYEYDDNGNLIIDRNKNILLPINYSYLNKPEEINVDGTGKIVYLYDALGNKLRKTVTDNNNVVKATEYMGPFVYQDSVLQYVQHEEGRSRPNPAVTNGWLHDYYMKDHLGNVRTVVNMKETDLPYFYNAGLEIAHAHTEGLIWSHLDEVRENSPDVRPDDVMAALLDGSDPERRIGTAIMLRVMPGDKFKIEADSWYEDINNNTLSTGADMAESLISALTNGNLYGGGPVAELGENVALISEAFSSQQFITAYEDLMSQNFDPELPAAYLNYMVFDDNLALQAGSNTLQVSGSAENWVANESGYIEIGQPGYIAVWTSNKGAGSVYYDKVSLTYYKGSVIEENHYYPFGLTLTQTATGVTEQPYKYQGIELNQDFSLETYETFYRGLDPQIGRFQQPDPLSELFVWQSPYTSMDNNPASKIDPDGNYSRVGAWLRNWAWDGNGIAQNQSGVDKGEWGVTYGQRDADGKTRTHYQVRGEKAKTYDEAAKEFIDDQDRINNALKNGEITLMDDGTYQNAEGRDINETMNGQDKVKAFLSDVGMAATASAPQINLTKATSIKQASNQVGGRANREWEELFEWGSRPEGAVSAYNRISNEYIQKLKNAGVALKDIKEWQRIYWNAYSKKMGQSNVTAKYRYELMEAIKNLW